MTISSDDQPKGIPALSRRQENWASLYLHNSFTYSQPIGKPYSCATWSEWVKTVDRGQVDALIKKMNTYLLPKEKVQWIDPKNQRRLLGIERILMTPPIAPNNVTMPYRRYFELDYESRYDNIMLNLDIWDVDLTQKEGLIASIREILTSQQLDHTKTQWLSKEDQTQLDWALDYLRKTSPPQLKTPLPTSPDEQYAYILGTLDQPGQHHLERKVFLDSMRRAWSQYKYRYTGKSQRQVYFSLGKEARSKLEDAAEHQNRRKSDIVEELILRNL